MRGRRALVVAVVVVVVGLVGGCARTVGGQARAEAGVERDAAVVEEYFERHNAAAADGAPAQRAFLQQTQHPDYPGDGCSLGDLTLTIEPTLSTLRLDPGWQPQQARESPRGRVYVVAVTVTVKRAALTIGSQIGSVHVVVLDGVAHGFAPCPG